jgi:cardiolipin synthase
MNRIVHVAIPLVRVKTHLEIQKGQPWSIIEHLVLDAIAKNARTVSDLAQGLQLPRSIASASLVRLMRVDWVELQEGPEGVRFGATEPGIHAAARRHLPYRYVLSPTARSHLYEQLLGHVFRLDELSHFNPGALPRPDDGELLTQITGPKLPAGFFRIDEVEDCLLDDDEIGVNIRPGVEYQSERTGLFTVEEGAVTNLPPGRDLTDLESRILRAAQEALATQKHERRSVRSAGTVCEEPLTNALKFVDIRVEPEDLIMGARPHWEAVARALSNAQSRLIIHSTFLSKKSIDLLLPLMTQALDRREDLSIDILWGQKEPEDPPRRRQDGSREPPTAAEIVAEVEGNPALAPYLRRLRFHQSTTNSHAKVLVYDPVDRGRYVALLGSCNWLASQYRKIEASIFLCNTVIVKDLLKILARAVYAGSGVCSPMVNLLLRMSKGQPPDPPDQVPNARASLVVDEAHIDCMYRMRQQAERTVLLVSHRMGPVARPGALVPLAAACAKGRVTARLVYGKLEVEDIQLTQWHADAQRYNIRITPLKRPPVHAKFLAWDEDHVVITSQNWLSADPGPSYQVKELGVLIDAPGIGTRAAHLFDESIKRA